jgi:putative SOS response-associated peptidase YedK
MIIIGQVLSLEKIENTFEVVNKYGIEECKNYALYPEDSILAITLKDRHRLTKVSYGLIPFWIQDSQKHFVAPIEGKTITDGQIKLKKGIIHEPAFRKPIREMRSVIPLDYFILSEGEKSMLFFNEQRPFVLAGLIDYWKPSIVEKNRHTGAALLTLPARGIYKDYGFTRQPMIIDDKNWKYWLKDISLTEVTHMMEYATDKPMNGYPVENNFFVSRQKNKEIIQPIGKYVKPITKLNTKEKVRSKFRKTGKLNESEKEQQAWRQPF